MTINRIEHMVVIVYDGHLSHSLNNLEFDTLVSSFFCLHTTFAAFENQINSLPVKH